MTDRNKFEEMLERLINEDREGAEELFHEIVVEKSRDIYQSIIESEDEEIDEADEDDLDESEDEDLDEADDEDLDESDDEDLDESVDDEEVDESEDEEVDEMFGLDEFEVEADPMAAMGGDATDDMMGDIEMGGDDEEGEEGEGGAEEAFADLEDALEALKAEFEAMMGGEGDDEDEEGDDMDMDGDDEEEKEAFAYESADEDEDDEDEVKESAGQKSATETMREYVEKINATMGDNGANTTSIVAGKNDMGGTAKNIAQSKTENGVEANKGKIQGSALNNQTPKVDDAGNVNKVGNKKGAATKMSNQPGHGAEKKGKPETADKSAGSMLNGAPKRAK